MSDRTSADLSQELAKIALAMQAERTGHSPKAVTVVASDDTVVLTLHEPLTHGRGAGEPAASRGPLAKMPAARLS